MAQEKHKKQKLTLFEQQTVESADWVQNQLVLRIFFWIAEMYKVEVDNEAG